MSNFAASLLLGRLGEAWVECVLIAAGYRVERFGHEQIRLAQRLLADDLGGWDGELPDLVVRDRAGRLDSLVEVKTRSSRVFEYGLEELRYPPRTLWAWVSTYDYEVTCVEQEELRQAAISRRPPVGYSLVRHYPRVSTVAFSEQRATFERLRWLAQRIEGASGRAFPFID